jgi:hypothetical protein
MARLVAMLVDLLEQTFSDAKLKFSPNDSGALVLAPSNVKK